MRRYRDKKRARNPDENRRRLCWSFHFPFDFSQVGSSEGNFESALVVFFNVKLLKKLCTNEIGRLCSGFVATVSEPACIKTPSWREAARTKRSLP